MPPVSACLRSRSERDQSTRLREYLEAFEYIGIVLCQMLQAVPRTWPTRAPAHAVAIFPERNRPGEESGRITVAQEDEDLIGYRSVW